MRKYWQIWLAAVLTLLICGLLTPKVFAGNSWIAETNLSILLRGETGSVNYVNNLTVDFNNVNSVTANTATEREGVSCMAFDSGDYLVSSDANLPSTLFDGTDFTICAYMRFVTYGTRYAIAQGTAGSDLSVNIGMYDQGAVESIRLQLGYGDGSSTDSYTHASDLGSSDWYWVGAAVDVDGNVRIRVWDVIADSQKGTDIDTACLNTPVGSVADVTVGLSMIGQLDEVVVLDTALSFVDMNTVRTQTWLNASGPFSYYCATDGDNGRMGTTTVPWGPISGLVGSGLLDTVVADLDTIYLKTGYHGSFLLGSATNNERQRSDWVYVIEDSGATATLGQITVNAATHWHFEGLEISPENGDFIGTHAPEDPPAIINGTSSTGVDYIKFESCDIHTIEDSSGWSTNDWTVKTWHGIRTYGEHDDINNCTITNVCIGWTEFGLGATFTNNTIDGFCSDGIYSSMAADITITDNWIANSYINDPCAWVNPDPDYHWHVDMIQLATPGTGTNLNVSRNYANASIDPTRASRKWLMGFQLVGSITDGVVENNVVVAQHPANAFAFAYGEPPGNIDGLLIANNTILEHPGWGDDSYIRFQSDIPTRTGVYIINNITHSWKTGAGITDVNNFDIDSYTRANEFVDDTNADYHLVPGSSFIDEGTASYGAPTDDIEGNVRSAPPDAGAYEWQTGEGVVRRILIIRSP